MAAIVARWKKFIAFQHQPIEWRSGSEPIVYPDDWKEGDLHSECEEVTQDDHASHTASEETESQVSSYYSSDSASESESATDLELDALKHPCEVDQLVWRVLDRYEPLEMVLNKLGRKVHFMRRRETGQICVVTFHQDMHDALRVQNVPREVRIIQALNGAPHVAQLLEWAFVEPDLFITVTPCYANFPVMHAVLPHRFLMAKVMRQLLEGIAAMHERGVVHRDIALQNITWDPIKEELNIIDFDCAAFDRLTGFKSNVGRDLYFAPEMSDAINHSQELVVSYDKRVDEYAAGIIFYMMLRNTTHVSRNGVRKFLKRVRKHKKGAKDPALDLLEKMLRYEKKERITIAEALRHPFLTETKPDEAYLEFRKELNEAMSQP
mgnify:CR=1 FL=1